MFELLLCFSGWCGMALGMDRHHEDAWARTGGAQRLRLLRRAGAALLVLSLVFALGRPGTLTVPLSLAWWFTAWSLAALAATAAATWLPRRMPLLALLALATAMAFWPMS